MLFEGVDWITEAQTVMPTLTINDLPNELLDKILSSPSLTASDYLALSVLSRRINTISIQYLFARLELPRPQDVCKAVVRKRLFPGSMPIPDALDALALAFDIRSIEDFTFTWSSTIDCCLNLP